MKSANDFIQDKIYLNGNPSVEELVEWVEEYSSDLRVLANEKVSENVKLEQQNKNLRDQIKLLIDHYCLPVDFDMYVNGKSKLLNQPSQG